MLDVAPALENDRYRLVRRLGQGGAATVYQAWDARLEVWRAIKLLDARTLSASSRARFEREARTMAKVRHRNVLVVYDVVAHGDRPYLVMDLVPGGSLADLLVREGSLSPRLACRIVREVLGGLQCAHEHGIVHRDVKPHNILLASDGTPLVSDFGIARVDTDDLTRTGAIVGTLAYMAPEQRSNAKDADARADVYAAACTLYTLIAGREPHDPYVDTAATWERIPEPLVPILRRATRWERGDRWPTAVAFSDALAAVEADLPETESDDLPAIPRAETFDPPPPGERAAPVNATFVDDTLPSGASPAAPTTAVPAPAAPAPTPPQRGSRAAVFAGLAGVAAIVLSGAWWLGAPTSVEPVAVGTPRFTEVTTNDPIANPTRFYSLSPDGADLIYQTPRGLWRHRLDAGVPDEPLALPPELADRDDLVASYVPDGRILLEGDDEAWWLADGKATPAPLGEALEASDAEFLSDGRFVAVGAESVWIGSPSGLDRLVRPLSPDESVRVLEVSPDETRVATVVSGDLQATLELIRLDGSGLQVLVRGPRLVIPHGSPFGSSAIAWLDDRHLAYVLQGASDVPSVLMRLDVETLAEAPIATFPTLGDAIDQMYRVPGTDSLTYEVTRSASRVWVGRLDEAGERLEDRRRLTLQDADEMRPAWLDATTVVYQGLHDGRLALFSQALDERAPRLWAVEPGGALGRPTRGPTGILASGRRPESAHPSLVRIRPVDGPHDVWIEDDRDVFVRCSGGASPAHCLCAWTGEDRRMVAPAIDAGCPTSGTEVRVGDLRDGAYPSADGRSALVVDEEALWRLDLATGAQRRVPVGTPRVQYALWGPDETTALVSGWTPRGACVLASVDLDGAREPIELHAGTGWVAVPALSPDGRGLAWQEDQMSARIWRLDGAALDP